MECTHEVEHLVGTKDGIKCRNCGKTFATFAELVADRPKKQEKKVETPAEDVAVEAPAETVEAVEAPAEKPKKSTKKGAK